MLIQLIVTLWTPDDTISSLEWLLASERSYEPPNLQHAHVAGSHNKLQMNEPWPPTPLCVQVLDSTPYCPSQHSCRPLVGMARCSSSGKTPWLCKLQIKHGICVQLSSNNHDLFQFSLRRDENTESDQSINWGHNTSLSKLILKHLSTFDVESEYISRETVHGIHSIERRLIRLNGAS